MAKINFSFVLVALLLISPLIANAEAVNLLGQDFAGVVSAVKKVNRAKPKKSAYSIPKIVPYKGGNECQQNSEIIAFKNSVVSIEAVGYNSFQKQDGLKGTGNIYFYFARALPENEALKITSDFAPFLKTSNILKPSTISPNEGNECTPGNGGLRYQVAKEKLELFYQEIPPTKLVDQALISLD